MSNVVYAMLVEWMDEKERAKFERTLRADPKRSSGPNQARSRNVPQLMAVLARTRQE